MGELLGRLDLSAMVFLIGAGGEAFPGAHVPGFQVRICVRTKLEFRTPGDGLPSQGDGTTRAKVKYGT